METLTIVTTVKLQECERAIHKVLKNEGLIFLYLIQIEPCNNSIDFRIESTHDSEERIPTISGLLKDSNDAEAPYIQYLNDTAIDCTKTKLLLKTKPLHETDNVNTFHISLTYKKFDGGNNRFSNDLYPSVSKTTKNQLK